VSTLLRGVTSASAVREAARTAGRGLIQVACGPDPAPAWRPRWRRWLAGALAAIGAGLVAITILGVVLALRHPRSPWSASFHGVRLEFLLAGPAQLAPLLLAARFPLLAWRLAYLTVLLVPLVPGQSQVNPAQVAVLVIVFCVAGLRYSGPVLWSMWALMLVPAWLWIGPGWAKPAAATIALTVGTAALDVVRAWRRARRALAAQAELAEREQARRAVLEERARIAREMHDVVAHHLSLMAVQAETAPYRVTGLSPPALAEFSSLSGAARAALADMRRLLGVLRSDQPAERAPQPQLADLPALAAASRRAGVTVELSMPAACDQVPPSVGVCAYRIMQEALSNAGRHAPGAAVAVHVGQHDGSLRLQVSNGPGAPARPPRGGGQPGHGLAGMRERVALLGGSLSAGPTAGGGFAVRAVLPLAEPAP
jgi:signal transduction histidine kinase